MPPVRTTLPRRRRDCARLGVLEDILQLVGLGGELLVAAWGAFQLPPEPEVRGAVTFVAHALFWAAAVINRTDFNLSQDDWSHITT